MKMIYGKASNRLNELETHVPYAKREFDSLINSIASWQNCYTLKMEDKLVKDLRKLSKKWEHKAAKSAGWFDKKG
tara:strand:- start:105 stop:329 length:225 start_codon:yes stop_codon:yes gene_type:complete